MIRIALLSALVAAGAAVPAVAAQQGGMTAISSAAWKTTNTDGSIANVQVAVTVTNSGSAKEPSNTLQSVEIWQDGTKTGTKGIPPLGPGRSYTFTYTAQRNRQAPVGTTHLVFKLVGDNAAGTANVKPGNRYKLDV
jgi:hypothetical protein